ncbi:MAG TPA: GNAT family N-acetyltransferase [Phycisphaerae bacterium]|nr:GNAT family N-acetyltransferase [Phycisphaerae bacterium]
MPADTAVRIRQLSAEEVAALTPATFTLAPIFDNLPRYAGLQGALFLAAIDNQPAACAALAYLASPAEKGALHIDHFVVLPSFRGHGLGSKLMHAILDHARSLSIRTLQADIPGWCPEWRAFYSRFGFVFTKPASDDLTNTTPVELHLDAA